MNCLAQRRKFKNKRPVWSDPNDKEPDEEIVSDEENDRTAKRLHDYNTDDSDRDDDDCDIFASDVRSKKISLETKELKFKHHVHINTQRSYSGSVKQVQFHPKSRVALVSLSRGQADLFEVDGERNRYVQNIKLPPTNSPFCAFINDGESIMITSEKYGGIFYIYDMMTGQIKSYSLRVGKVMQPITDFTVHGKQIACRREASSEIFLLNSVTYEIESSIKLNDNVKVVRFTDNGDIMIASENASAYVWDMRKISLCKNKFIDDGTIHITSLDLSDTSQQVAIGNDSGMVNIYELSSCLKERFPSPIKTLSNLKTNVDILKYNSTGELLIMGASEQKNGFRLIHSHSGTVYKNFPVLGKKYDHLISTDFSPLSGYLGLGCSNGRAQLIRLPYYKSY